MTNEVNDQKQEESNEEFVSKKAYAEVSSDMHKYKQELQGAKARLAELEAMQEANEKAALEEQGRWEELYKQSQEQLDAIKVERDNEKNQFVNYHKKNSVLQRIGGFKKDDYNKFINVENIKLNEDGSIDTVSLETEADRIKQEYPELLKTLSSTKLPTEAPSSHNSSKSYDSMSETEKHQLKLSLLQKPTGI